MYKFVLTFICFSLATTFSVAAQTDSYLKTFQERSEKNLKDVDFTIKFKDNQNKFRQGEIIQIELTFSTSTPNQYNFLNRTYDRSGRLYLDGLIIDKKENTFDPLADYFHRGGSFMSGGLFSVPTLDSTPQIINYELNEYLSFKEAGKYRIYISSPRVSLKKEGKDNVSNALGGGSISLVSNILEFEILPAEAKWQKEKLAEAVKIISEPNNEGIVRRGCDTLRFLGTEAAAKEMLTRFGRGDKVCEFDNYIGLYGSPARRFIVDEMEKMLVSPDYAVTNEFFQMLVRLRHFLNNPEPEKSDFGFIGFGNKKEEEKKNLIKLKYLEKFVKALPDKNEKAFQKSLETYFSFHAKGEKQPSPELTNALINSFSKLSKRTQWIILQNSLDKLKTPAMLPVLQAIYNNVSRDNLDSGPFGRETFEDDYNRDLLNLSIKGIYALDRSIGKQIILNEMRRPKQKVYTDILELLPKTESPETETILLEKLNGGNIPADGLRSVFMLIDHYETPKLISKLRETYADEIGKIECGAQIEVVKIFLKSDIRFGEEMLDKAVKSNVEKGCIGANLAEVIEPHWSSEIERIVSGILEDDNLFAAGNAAELLGKNGSIEARDKIWKRFERFNKEEQNKEISAAQKRNPDWQISSAEWKFAAAVSESPNWFFEQESFKRLSALCLYGACQEQVDKLNKIFRETAQIKSAVDEENKVSFSIYQYKNMSLDILKKKLEQFPPDTEFSWISNVKNPNDEQHFQEIKAFLENRGMKLGK